jgi:nucleoside-diphosphate-sugar epimerase
MNILLTGSSGTIGTRLFEKLVAEGHSVTGADKRRNHWNTSLNAKTIIVDLLNSEDLKRLPKVTDLIIHLAANARVYELVKNPELAFENMIMTSNMLEFARENRIRRIIFSSSREVYGNLRRKKQIGENEVRIENCESPYAASKISSEAFLHSYRRVFEADFVILRFSNVYGMYDDSDRVIPLWIREALNKEDLIVFGERKVLDFTYIDDTVEGVCKVIDTFDNITGETFNIASGKGVKLTYVANMIRKLLGGTSKTIVEKNRPGEVWKFTADISKAKKVLHYEPKIHIDEGLSRTVQWYEEYYQTRGQDK